MATPIVISNPAPTVPTLEQCRALLGLIAIRANAAREQLLGLEEPTNSPRSATIWGVFYLLEAIGALADKGGDVTLNGDIACWAHNPEFEKLGKAVQHV